MRLAITSAGLAVNVSLAASALVACGQSHEPSGDAAVDARDPGDVEITAGAAAFTFCRCHHGCGPGADGWVDVSVANDGPAPVSLRFVDLLLAPLVGEEIPTVTGGGYLRSDLGGDTVVVAPGSSLMTRVTAYIDLLTDSEPLVGDFRVRLVLTVDAAGTTAETEPITVPFIGGGGC